MRLHDVRDDLALHNGTPVGVAPGTPLRAGEPFPLDDAEVGDCPALLPGLLGLPFPGSCVLDTGHGGPHVAGDGEIVLAVWGR